MSKTFKIIYDLNGLTDEAIEQYKRDVSEYYDLDPGMNWFDVLWMTDPETGLRRRQLYARRGTTDVLRDKRKISITDMTMHEGQGYVSFTAKGIQASTGRQEIAVGAHAIEGLKGERLAAAIATAETRAGRRLTLKYCGLGILDHSEVTDPVDVRGTPTDAAPVAVAPMFAPSVAPAPNAAPGKIVDKATADATALALAEAAEITKQAVRAASAPAALGAPYGVSSTGLHKYAEAMEKEAPGTVTVTRSDGMTITVPPGHSAVVDVTPLAPTALETPSAPKPRRTRRKPNTVEIGTPGQPSQNETGLNNEPPVACLDCKRPLSEHILINSVRTCPPPVSTQVNSAVPIQANPAVPTQVLPAAPPLASPAVVTAVPHPESMTMTLPTGPSPLAASTPPPSLVAAQAASPAPSVDFPGKPTLEQQTTYREELRAYSNIILPGAGMVPSPGIGGPSIKLRMYAERMAGKSTQLMTVEDWEEFFEQLKQFRATNGDKSLVKYINDVIGAK